MEALVAAIRELESGRSFIEVLSRFKAPILSSPQGASGNHAAAFLYAIGLATNLTGSNLDYELHPEEERIFKTMAAAKFSALFRSYSESLPVCDPTASDCLLGERLLAVRQSLRNMERAGSAIRRPNPETYSAAYTRYIGSIAATFHATARIFIGDGAPPPGTATDQRLYALLAADMDTLLEIYDSMRNRDYVTMTVALIRVCDLLNIALPEWFKRYASPLAQLASVKTSEDMQKILETIAAPPGSYRGKRGNPRFIKKWAKRETTRPYRSTLTLNAYVGFQGGGEILRRGDLDRQGLGGRVGLFAPIGLEWSRGLRKSGAIGGFFSFLDLGALVDYRVSAEPGSDDMTPAADNSPNLTFAQVISPGLFLVLAIPGAPISIGVGAAYTPKLRSILTEGTKDANAVDSLRFGGFLAFDIPILVLARGGKAKKRAEPA